VKGVLADYASRKELLKIEAELTNMKNTWKLKNLADSHTIGNEKKDLFFIQKIRKLLSKNEEENEEDEDFSDDEFMKEYRRKRLEELQKDQHPSFGFVQNLTRDEFVDFIDQEKSNVFVVIHLYQDYIPACVKINKCLSSLAMKHTHVKFGKILSTEAETNYDDIALPTILVYQGGDVFQCFVRITDEIGITFDVDHLESLFLKSKVFSKK